MHCEKCGYELESHEIFCPKCGYRVTRNQEKHPPGSNGNQALGEEPEKPAGGTADANNAIDGDANIADTVATTIDTTDTDETNRDTTDSAKNYAASSPYQWQKPGDSGPVTYGNVSSSIPPDAKSCPSHRRSYLWIIGLTGGTLLCLLGIVIAVNATVLGNFLRRTFSSPAEYYQYVEQQAAADSIDELTATYALMLEYMTYSGTDLEMDLEMGDTLLSMIGSDTDLSWLHHIGLDMQQYYLSDQRMAIDIAAELGEDNRFISMNYCYDFPHELIYVQVPELHPDYLGLPMDTDELESLENSLELLDRLPSLFPDAETMSQFLNKYVSIALGCVDEAEMTNDTLEAGDISQNCTRLQITLDEELRKAVTIALLTEMRQDEDMKQIIQAFAEWTSSDTSDELYNDFTDSIDDTLENIDSLFYDSGSQPTLTIWVDNKGIIRGRELSADAFTFAYAMPRDSNAFGQEITLQAENTSLLLTGNGTYEDNKLSGEYEFLMNAGSIVNIEVEDFDPDAWKDRHTSGRFTLRSSSMLNMLVSDMYLAYYDLPEEISNVLSRLENFRLVFESEMEGLQSTGRLTIFDGENIFASLTSSVEYHNRERDIPFPSPDDIVMSDDTFAYMLWLSELDFEGYLADIEERLPIPSEILDSIRSVTDMYF